MHFKYFYHLQILFSYVCSLVCLDKSYWNFHLQISLIIFRPTVSHLGIVDFEATKDNDYGEVPLEEWGLKAS